MDETNFEAPAPRRHDRENAVLLTAYDLLRESEAELASTQNVLTRVSNELMQTREERARSGEEMLRMLDIGHWLIAEARWERDELRRDRDQRLKEQVFSSAKLTTPRKRPSRTARAATSKKEN